MNSNSNNDTNTNSNTTNNLTWIPLGQIYEKGNDDLAFLAPKV